MAAASGLTMAITGAANWLGPVLAGVIGTYPVITTVVLTFTHHQWSRGAAVALLREILFSWISFASCFLVIGLTLHEDGLAVSFALGALAAAVTSGLVLALDRWAQRRSWPETRADRARDLAEQDRELTTAGPWVGRASGTCCAVVRPLLYRLRMASAGVWATARQAG